jgi:short subunit dehydrogenase-like uncharacterized protein
MIDAHHDRARETGARIVHCCGFDSIPPDLGTVMLQAHAREVHGAHCRVVKYLMGEGRGGLSGGTFASIANIAKQAADPEVRRKLFDPFGLDPGYDGPLCEHADKMRLVADQRGIAWDADVGRWTGPYPFAITDARVVRRTSALLGYPWGKDFVFRESMAPFPGAMGWLVAAGLTVGIAAGTAAMGVTPVRDFLVNDVFPAPGEGPSPEARAKGFFVSRLVGELGDGQGKVYGFIRGAGDPGYGETSKMLAESAVCLAKDVDVRKEGGVLTPGACMGMRLVERLREAGMTWKVGDSPQVLEG